MTQIASGPFALKHKFAPLDDLALSAAGRFSGYASLFGEIDLAGDQVEPGAFAASLAKRGASGIRMLWQHDPNEPIGAWTAIREDRRGLYVEGVLAEGVARAREAHALLKSGAVDGLSIGFRTVRSARGEAAGQRRILEADLWEISIVTFPMLPSARIAEVKGGSAEGRLAARIRAAAGRLAAAGSKARFPLIPIAG